MKGPRRRTGLPSLTRSWQPRGVQSQIAKRIWFDSLRFGTAAQCFGPQLSNSTVAEDAKAGCGVCPRTYARHVKQIPKCNVGTKIYHPLLVLTVLTLPAAG